MKSLQTGLILLSTVGVCQRASGLRFQGLGDFPEGQHISIAEDISPDGSTVVGLGTQVDEDPRNRQKWTPFMWTEVTGLVPLKTQEGEMRFANPGGVSNFGSAVAGSFKADPENISIDRAFRWTEGGGIMEIPNPFHPSTPEDIAYDISADGNIVVGRAYTNPDTHAFRWTSETGMTLLIPEPGTGFDSYDGSRGYAVSDDGSTIVGRLTHEDGGNLAFRWREGEGFVGLGFIDENRRDTRAWGVSADGSVVVGTGLIDPFGERAFKWTAETGIRRLDDLEVRSRAWGVSADGSIVVGHSGAVGGAAVWEGDSGPRGIAEILTNDFGVDLGGWDLTNARSVSADGRIVTGTGRNPNGDTEAWIAELTPIPEPPTLTLICLAALFVPGLLRVGSHTDDGRCLSSASRRRMVQLDCLAG